MKIDRLSSFSMTATTTTTTTTPTSTTIGPSKAMNVGGRTTQRRRLQARVSLLTWVLLTSFLGYAFVNYSILLSQQQQQQQQQQQRGTDFALSLSYDASSNKKKHKKKKSRDEDMGYQKNGSDVITPENSWKSPKDEWWRPNDNPKVPYDDPMCVDFKHSILKPSHGCEVNKDTLTVFCNFNNLRIDNTKIDLSRGGEDLKDVMGRPEDVELPKYRPYAFTVPARPNYNVPMQYRSGLHYVENVLNALKYPRPKNLDQIDTTTCHQTFEGTTLFITRYEYVNLYHTLTDLWNAYFVLPVPPKGGDKDQPEDDRDIEMDVDEYFNRPHQIVFLDGHAKGGLDDVWKTLFGDFHYIKHLPKGGVCFERAIFVPAGYKSPLFTDFVRARCPHKAMGRSFSNFVLNRFGIDPYKVVPQRGRILLIDRQHYVSHPRSDQRTNHQISRQVNNFEDVKKVLKEKIAGVTRVDLVRLETLDTFADQIRLVRQAHVVVAMHGAALSHLMFMDGTYETEQRRERQKKQRFGGIFGENVVQPAVVEMAVERHDFFEEMARWKGVKHEIVDVTLTNSHKIGMFGVSNLIAAVTKAMV